MNDLPVILSYFAQSQDSMYLSMLEREQSTIQLAWEGATELPQNPIAVNYVARGNSLSKQDQIINDIKKYGRRIVLFQFSGHAGPDAIQLNDGAGGPEGIAELLKEYAPNLKVVVLNGCSTHGQVETLFEQGIRAVVATSSAVNDKHATQFAITFHQTLCEGKSIRDAFRDAISVLKTKKLDKLLPHDMRVVAVSRSMLNTSPKAGTLWGLFTQDNGEDNVSNSNWWVISGRPDVNQPPANFIEAAKYVELKSELDEANNDFAKTKAKVIKYPDDTDFQEDLLRIDERRTEIQKKIDVLREAVLKLAEEFTRIPINTERLRLAKAHFDAGEYEKARAIFDTERDVMKTELDALLDETENLKTKTAKNQENRTNKANEYLLGALANATAFDQADRFEKTLEYFELSLKADRNAENLSAYAYFLQQHNQLRYAQSYYEEVLKIIQQLAQINPSMYQPKVATTLNNLANLHFKQNEFTQAQPYYEEALDLYRQLNQENPTIYSPELATALNNFANLLSNTNNREKAQAYFEEALYIRRELAQTNPKVYLSSEAQTLGNLALLFDTPESYGKAEFFYKESLNIYYSLAETNPPIYLPDVAMMLSNLALSFLKNNQLNKAKPLYEEAVKINRQFAQVNPLTYLPNLAMNLDGLALVLTRMKELSEAQALYLETLQIYRQLAQSNPQAYLLNVALTSTNISAFFCQEIPNKSLSFIHVDEALRAVLFFKGPSYILDENISTVLRIVEAWGEDPDAFLQRVKDSIKPTDE